MLYYTISMPMPMSMFKIQQPIKPPQPIQPIQPIQHIKYLGDGQFEFVKNTQFKVYFQEAHKVITQCDLWEWLRDYDNKNGYNSGFEETKEYKNPQLERIRVGICDAKYGHTHSGSSYFIVLRTMDFISKYGYVMFAQTCCN